MGRISFRTKSVRRASKLLLKAKPDDANELLLSFPIYFALGNLAQRWAENHTRRGNKYLLIV